MPLYVDAMLTPLMMLMPACFALFYESAIYIDMPRDMPRHATPRLRADESFITLLPPLE